MNDTTASSRWPVRRIAEAIACLAQVGGLAPRQVELGEAPAGLADADALNFARWVEGAADWLGVEAEPVVTTYPEIDGFLAAAGPALLQLPGEPRSFLLLVRATRQGLVLLGPDHEQRTVPRAHVRALLCAEVEAPMLPRLDSMLDEAGVTRRGRARAELLAQWLRAATIEGFWLLRLPPGADLRAQARRFRLPRRAAGVLAGYAAVVALGVLSWIAVGRGALTGTVDHGWLIAWVVLLATAAALRALVTAASGRLAIDVGALLKQRLLAGALALDSQQVRLRGAGQFLGWVLESDAIESLALSGGLAGVFALIELVAAFAVLAASGHAWPLVPALVVCLAAVAWLGRAYLGGRRRWTGLRLDMTHDLVEQIVGHRTRIAQQAPEARSDREDQALHGYLDAGARLDRAMIVLTGLLPGGWLLLGLLVLGPAFVADTSPAAALVVAVGGVLLAHRALRSLVGGLTQLLGARVASESIAPMFHATAGQERVSPVLRGELDPDGEPAPLLDVDRLSHHYPGRREPALDHCNLQIHRGERVLLEGRSGGGKSTLLSLLAGLREPQHGLVLLDALDRRTLGLAGWRQRVVAVPQFHDNHVMTGTLAFNLLMGRRWPPTADDLAEAQEVCEALALGELLGRMPAGLLQVVGETGWQLSHGEQSRLFIARALLQGADLTLLDESFAALDPETLRIALACVLERAPTLLVVAHP
ncbi:ATP-binding cassette domain-containing protein [Nannocystis sp. SCPEA4]|uniref:ATP-binding cassette domain-containing protein n=1 Tax=Nannocystis sp. SCPEA4 TaxID=2996787 RepID=UPI002270A622|nr:ATP-binding cassette domain-containing protein [Nannocystis sp. SCPEA4]MCY1062657.1 ATP-binding cassette domain-containing protein [Nannocystis sp. SCPEA4]